MLNTVIQEICSNKVGIEIGGPSHTGNIIYEVSSRMDNVIFSNTTVWSTHLDVYKYGNSKTGNLIINDAVNITSVETATYDFCFAAHCLEHIANPLKAVGEWLRIVKAGGYVVLILPEKSCCFDHKRSVTPFSTLLSQYQKNVGEDDLSTLPEILRNHDLSMDPPAGTFEQFTRRSLDNFNNRCLHHYVYSPDLLKEICFFFKCQFVYTRTDGLNIWFIMKKL